MNNEIHANDIGTRFLITVQDNGEVVDISNSVSLTLIFRKPSDNLIYRPGTIYASGTDGKMYYDTIAGDLDETGNWKLQGRVGLPSGTYYTDIHTFKVHCNL